MNNQAEPVSSVCVCIWGKSCNEPTILLPEAEKVKDRAHCADIVRGASPTLLAQCTDDDGPYSDDEEDDPNNLCQMFGMCNTGEDGIDLDTPAANQPLKKQCHSKSTKTPSIDVKSPSLGDNGLDKTTFWIRDSNHIDRRCQSCCRTVAKYKSDARNDINGPAIGNFIDSKSRCEYQSPDGYVASVEIEIEALEFWVIVVHNVLSLGWKIASDSGSSMFLDHRQFGVIDILDHRLVPAVE
ncbi:hypothetical protein E6O75_ATG05588 [Venturia nashicola]|uniref:Uncharacterized protein n=1 Tax=Venturia nashicola TaxID=86259 RepID=A0A4Z1NXF5_9PEZI|nr:hypothetical protein E6O75_ATG05588 [Venturia nashicola]